MKSSNEFNVFAFYGIEHTAQNVERFFDASLRWFGEFGIQPDKLGVSGIDKTIVIEGHASEGENIELKGTITPPADPRAPIKLRVN